MKSHVSRNQAPEPHEDGLSPAKASGVSRAPDPKMELFGARMKIQELERRISDFGKKYPVAASVVSVTAVWLGDVLSSEKRRK